MLSHQKGDCGCRVHSENEASTPVYQRTPHTTGGTRLTAAHLVIHRDLQSSPGKHDLSREVESESTDSAYCIRNGSGFKLHSVLMSRCSFLLLRSLQTPLQGNRPDRDGKCPRVRPDNCMADLPDSLQHYLIPPSTHESQGRGWGSSQSSRRLK